MLPFSNLRPCSRYISEGCLAPAQVFTFIYLTELLLNMFGNWFWGFFGSSWCLFDLLIVLLSVIDAVYVIAGTSGNGLAVLRLLRIFRIVRIFNKLEDMRRILSANVSAFGPVINAIILFVVTLGTNTHARTCPITRTHTHRFLTFPLALQPFMP